MNEPLNFGSLLEPQHRDGLIGKRTDSVAVNLSRFIVLAGALCFAAATSCAEDWPQLRGPNHDGTVDAVLAPGWQVQQPEILWKRPLNAGFSSLVIANEKAATLVVREIDGAPTEVCLGMDARTGSELWAAPLAPAKYTGVGYDSGNYGAPGNQGGDGPRSTPTIDSERVYVTCSRLVVYCFDVENGKQLWSRDLIKEFGGAQISYENAASPLLVGDRLLVAGGGSGQSIICFDAQTGQTVWKGHDAPLTHSTPTLAKNGGLEQAIFYSKNGLLALRPQTGERLWHYKFPFRVCAAITPVVAGKFVYCSAGYGIGSAVCEVTGYGAGLQAAEVWRKRHNEPVASYWSTPIHRAGHLYGMFGFKKFHTAPFKCVDIETGEVKWEEPGFGHGNVILVGELLVALTGYGDLVLIRPTPAAYRELGRFTALTGKCWSTPAFSGGKLYARSTKEAVCIRLPKTLSPTLTEAKPRRALEQAAE